MYVTFEREALFLEVWSIPMTILSKKYGLSDNGLRKVCIGLNIPLPRAGHWAKQVVGKAPQRPQLQPTEGRTEYKSWRTTDPDAPSLKVQGDADWLQERTSFEKQPGNAIAVVAKPRKWHPGVEPIRAWLLECIAEYHAALKKRSKMRKEARRGVKAGLDSYYSDWDVRRHEPILGSTHKSTAMRVSMQTYERALSIFNALAFAAEDRGFVVTAGERHSRLLLTMEGSQFGLYVTELANDAPKLAAHRPDEELHGETSPMSVGKLRLNIERWAYGVNQIADTPDKPIESNLNKVFLHAYRHVVRQRKEDRQRAFMRQQEEERQRVRDEIERKRKEAERIRAEEEARRASLVSQSGNWEQANCIRALVTHIAAAGGQSSNNQTFSDWKSWALQVADDLDPTSALLESFQNFEKNADVQDASAIVMNL